MIAVVPQNHKTSSTASIPRLDRHFQLDVNGSVGVAATNEVIVHR